MKKLEAKRDYLEEYLQRYRKAQDAVPSVQMNLEMTEWEIQALSNRPDEADEIPFGDLEARFDREYDHLTRVLAMMPEYDPGVISVLSAVTTSGSASTYVYVARVGDLGTRETKEYSTKYTTAYRELQAVQSRPKQVRDLLEKLGNPQALERFDRALKAYLAVRSGTGQRTAAAAEMRTLLRGVQGDLFEKARRWPKENMKWETMAERLSKGQAGGTEHQEVINQEAVHGSLISRLSTVFKDREGSSLTNIDDLWTQVLDHIYIVLELVQV